MLVKFTTEGQTPFWVNPAAIASLEPSGNPDSCILTLTDGRLISIRHRPQQAVQWLMEAERGERDHS